MAKMDMGEVIMRLHEEDLVRLESLVERIERAAERLSAPLYVINQPSLPDFEISFGADTGTLSGAKSK